MNKNMNLQVKSWALASTKNANREARSGMEREVLERIEEKKQAAFRKPHSDSEETGLIYIYRIINPSLSTVADVALYKVGRTIDFSARQKYWDAQCPSQDHFWFKPIEVEFCHRTEQLVHLELHKICLRRPREECNDCYKKHKEIFELAEVVGVDTVRDVIMPIIREMAKKAAACPRR
ncbi:hypothetical protein PM082_022655 [Marasmius tenuissimus]|nr:hypothetical protein PM082_022655 [Marasmius tenuissimus]